MQFLAAAVVLVVSFAVIPIWQAPGSKLDSFKTPRDLADEQHFRNYSVRIYRDENGLGGVEILKDGRRVWSDVDGLVYQVGHVYEQIPGATDLKIGTDVTGDGLPDLVISRWSGGTHCCFDFFVLQLEPKFQALAKLEGRDADRSAFMDLNHDSVPEFVTADWVFAYWQTSFAFSARPRIVLRYHDGRYHLAPELMRKPPPSDREIDQAAEQTCRAWRGSTPWDETEFGNLTTYFADLLYSGNPEKAERYLRRALCGSKPEQQDFLKEFSQQIKESRYWPELSALTGDLVQ